MSVSATVWLLGATSCLTDISSEMVNGILPLYLIGYLGITPLQFGIIDGLYQGVSAVLRIAGGMLADRWHRHKEIAAIGYAVSAACKLALRAAGRSWLILAGVIALDRTGKGIRSAPRDALITLTTDRTALATSFGVHRALDAAGALLGPIVAFVLLAWHPDAYDEVFVVSFCVAVVGLGVLVLFVENVPRPVSAPAAHVASASFGTIFGRSGFGHLVIAGTALSVATMSDGFIYLTIQRRLHFAPMAFPLLYVATSLVYMTAAVPAGRLADRAGKRAVFVGGYVMLGVVYATLLAPNESVTWAIVGVAALGVYYAATDGVLMALAGQILPPTLCASGLATLTTCTSGARLFSSIAFGWMWMTSDATRAVRVFAIALAVAVSCAIVLLRRVADEAEQPRDDSRG